MARVYNKKDFLLYAEAEQNCLLESIQVVNNMIESKELEAFDGKMVNVKLERILKAIAKGLNFEFSPYGNHELRISYICDKRLVVAQGSCYYASHHDRLTFYFDSHNDPTKAISLNDKTFKWEVVKEKLVSNLKTIERYLASLQLDIENIDSLIEEREAIKKSMDDFRNKTNFVTRDFLEIPSVY